MSEPINFSRYRTQQAGIGHVEVDLEEAALRDVVMRRLTTDRRFRWQVMVIKLKTLAALAQNPEPDRAVQRARVQELEEQLYELMSLDLLPDPSPTEELTP